MVVDRSDPTALPPSSTIVRLRSTTRPEVPALRDLLRPDWSYAVLTEMVTRAGAVDGVRRRAEVSVDGLDWPAYAEPLTRIAELVAAAD